MSRIRWAPQAVEDLQAIRDFIGRDSSRYATAVVEQIVVFRASQLIPAL